MMKTKTKKYKSKIKEAIHKAAQDLHEAGLMDSATMRGFAGSCLATGSSNFLEVKELFSGYSTEGESQVDSLIEERRKEAAQEEQRG